MNRTLKRLVVVGVGIIVTIIIFSNIKNISNIFGEIHQTITNTVTVNYVANNPEKFDGKYVTLEAVAHGIVCASKVPIFGDCINELILSDLSSVALAHPSGNDMMTEGLTQEQINDIESIRCIDSNPIFKISGEIKVKYIESGFSKISMSTSIVPYNIEFVRCK